MHRGAESAADIDSVQPGLQQDQQYDAAGNRIDSESYVGEGNRLVQDAQFSYDYDKQGNLLKKLRNDNGDTWQYQWDPHGRLLKVTFTDNGNGDSDYTVHYGYDALGRQVTKKIDGAVDSFLGTVWDGALRQFELDLDTGAVENSYFHGPSGDLLAVDQGESVWAFSDLSGTTRSLGIHRADPAPDGHWDVAHRQYDDFGEQQPFAQSANDDPIDESGNGIEANPDKTLIGNDVNLFESVPEFFQGSQWDAQAELYTLGGSYYDPFTGRYVQDTGGENGYVFSGNSPNRDRVSLPDGVDNSHSFLRGLIGDENLAGAQDWQLFVGTTAVATGAVLGGYFALGAFGIVGTAGAATAATTSTLGASLSAAGSLLTYGSFGYSVARTALTFEGTGDLLADSASLGIDAVASATTGRLRAALLTVDAGINIAQGGRSVIAAGEAYNRGDYLGATVNVVGAGLGFTQGFVRHLELAEAAGDIGRMHPRAGVVRAGASDPLNPVTRSVGDLRDAGLKDAHHVIQDAAVRNLPGYDTNAAPGVQLPGPSTARGTPHYSATQIQRQSGGGTYAAERRIGYKALRRAGFSPEDARQAIEEADDYFRSLGVRIDTLTRIPGNRRG